MNTKENKTFYEYLKIYAEEDGDADLLLDENTRLSTAQTLALTEAYARALYNAGISEGDFVALQAKRSLKTALIIYALQTLGAVTVMCHPHAKVKSYLDETGVDIPVKAIITRENGVDWEIIACNGRKLFVPDYSEKNFYISRNADAAALIVFTSGSTSASKAVTLSQSNYLYFCEESKRVGWAASGDRAMVIPPLNHVLGLIMTFMCVVTRFSLFFPKHTDAIHLMECMQKYRITYVHAVPTTYIAAAAEERRGDYDLSALRLGVMGGGACGESQFRRLEEKLGITIITSYGMSECFGVTTTCPADGIDERVRGVGKLFDYINVKVTDKNGAEVKCGDTGEICLRGKTLMLGYYNNPCANAEAFDGEGWFHTGDLGYIDKDGILYLNGRIKDIIIRGGENISGAKIEKAITSLPFIKGAAVVGVKHDLYGEIPCAAVTLAQKDVTESCIAEALGELLLKNEIPARIIIMEELPLLGSGKPDKIKIKKIFENG